MTLTAGTVEIDVRGDLTPLQRDLTGVNQMAARAGSQTGTMYARGLTSQKSRIATAAGGLKSAFVLAGGVALGRAIKTFTFDAAMEARKVGAQTDAVIESTGGAAKVTAEEIAALAEQISNYSGIEDEAIQEGQNLLLTFKRIRNETGAGNKIFDQATKILTDMSVALGTDVKSGAIQVGKALNDPVKGVSALTRVGVTFSEKQKTLISRLAETGDIAGAQRIILEELRSEFGGSARAAGKVDPYKRLGVRLGNLGEMVGTKVLPVMDALAGGMIKTLKGTHPLQKGIEEILDISRLQSETTWKSAEIVAIYGEQLDKGVLSLDEYRDKVRLQVEALVKQAAAGQDVSGAMETVENILASSKNTLTRYQAHLEKLAEAFDTAAWAADNYGSSLYGINDFIPSEGERFGGSGRGGKGRRPRSGGGRTIPTVGPVRPTMVNHFTINADAATDGRKLARIIRSELESNRSRDARITSTRIASSGVWS